MKFLGRLLRYLFWLVVVSGTVALLRRLVGQMGKRATNPRQDVEVPTDTVSKKLVRDPICGMHVAEGLALPLRAGNELVHFCSAECRDKYLSQTRKLAANE